MFDDIERILAENLSKNRARVGFSQREVADRLTDLSGKQISAYMVHSWENNDTSIPAAIMPSMTEVLNCSSYDMYPHSRFYAEKEVRLLDSIKYKNERTRCILDYLINEWDGDDDAFWEFGLLYSALCRQDRKYIAQCGIEHFKDIMRNDPDSIKLPKGLDVDLSLLIRAAKALDK